MVFEVDDAIVCLMETQDELKATHRRMMLARIQSGWQRLHDVVRIVQLPKLSYTWGLWIAYSTYSKLQKA